MANDIRGLYGTFQKWLELEEDKISKKVPKKEIEEIRHNGIGPKIAACVLDNLPQFSQQVQKQVDVLRSNFRSLGFGELEINDILIGKSPKAGPELLVERGESFEKSAAEKIAKAQEKEEKEEAQRLLQNAKKAYLMAVDLGPSTVAAYQRLARLSLHSHMASTARDYAKQAIQNANAELPSLIQWLKTVEDPEIARQTPINFAGSALVEVGRYAEAIKLYGDAADEAKKGGDAHRAQAREFQHKAWIVEELQHPYSRSLKNADLPFADLDLALRARGIPSALLDGRGGPEFHVPDGKITERDILLFVGRSLEKNSEVRAALTEAGIDEGKFLKKYGETLRSGFKADLEKFQTAIKTDPVKAAALSPMMDAWAFELNWQVPRDPSERIENLKTLKSYYQVALVFSQGNDEKRTELKETLAGLDSEWALLVKDRYPGAEGLDGQGFLKPDQVESAVARVRSSLREFLAKGKQEAQPGQATQGILADRDSVSFLVTHSEFPLLSVETQQAILQDFSLIALPNPAIAFSSERRVAHAFYLKGQQAEARANWAQAVEFYEQAVQHAPEVPEIRLAAAKACLETGRFQSKYDSLFPRQFYQKAAAHLDAVTSRDPSSIEAWSLKGKVNLELGSPDHAQQYFEIALGIAQGQWFTGNAADKKLTQTLKDDVLKAGRAVAARANSSPPESAEVRLEDETLDKAVNSLSEWAGMGVYKHMASLDVSRMIFAKKNDAAKKLQDLLIQQQVAPEQVHPGRLTADPLPAPAEYQDYAFTHLSQFRKEIESVYGALPLDSEGKLDASFQSRAETEWKTGADEVGKKLKKVGLRSGSPEFANAFQAELEKPENTSLHALQTMLDPNSPARLKALAFFQFRAAKNIDFAAQFARSAGPNSREAGLAIRAYQFSAQSYELAFSLSQRPKDAKAAAMAYFAAADLAHKRGEEVSAKHLFLKGATALQGLRELPYPSNLFQDGEALELMGHALREAGKYPEAMQMYAYAWSAGNHASQVREGAAFVNKYQFSLEHVDPKFLKRFDQLEAMEEKGKFASGEKKELARMRRGLEMLKQINQEIFPGWDRGIRNSIFVSHGGLFFPSGIRPVEGATLVPDLWAHMLQNEMPLISSLRQEVLNTLKVPPDTKKLSVMEAKMRRLEARAESLRQADQAREEVLKKYPAYVQNLVSETGNWSLMKMHYEGKVDNYDQNVDDIPPEWNPAALNKLPIWTGLSDAKTENSSELARMQGVMAAFGTPSLIPADVGDLDRFEVEVKRVSGMVFKTEVHMDGKTGQSVSELPIDPMTGGRVFELNADLSKVLGREEKPDAAEQPNLWVRTELGKGTKELGTTKTLIVSLQGIKKDYQETVRQLEQAKKHGDSVRTQELEKKLGDLNEKCAKLVANSKTFLEQQSALFSERSGQFLSMIKKLKWPDEHGNSRFGNDLMDGDPFVFSRDKLDALLKGPPQGAGGSLAVGLAIVSVIPVPKDPLQSLDSLVGIYQDLANTQAKYLHHLAVSNAAISNQWNPSTGIYNDTLSPEVERYDQIFAGIHGPEDIDGFLLGTQAFLEKTDQKMFQDLPGNLRDGIADQLQNWRKIKEEMGKDFRIGEVDKLIGSYEAAQQALDDGDERKALALFQIATDSKNALYAQDAYKGYKQFESMTSLALELAIVTVATVLTGGTAGFLAPEIMAAEGFAALAVEGTTFMVMEKGVRAGLYYGADIGQNPFQDSEGNWLMPWDYALEDVKMIAMFGALKFAGKGFRSLMLADAETKALVGEAFALSEGRAGGRGFSRARYVSKAMEQRFQAKLGQMGLLRKAGFRAGELVTEAVAFQLWNNVSTSIDVLYQDLVHGRKLDWGQQIKQVNSSESITHGLVFLVGLKLGGLLTHPIQRNIGSKRLQNAQKAIQGDIGFQTSLAFHKKAAEFHARLIAYDADPEFKYLSPRDRKDAARLISLGDQTYLPEVKKGRKYPDHTFMTPDQKAWLETRDILQASIRHSETRGMPDHAQARSKKIEPQPMPAPDSSEFTAAVEGLMPFTSEADPGPTAREAVKNWLRANVPDQGRYRQVLGGLAGERKILTIHNGKAYLEDAAKVQIRTQQASRLYENLAKRFGIDPAKSPHSLQVFLHLAATDPTFNPTKVEQNLGPCFKILKEVVKRIPAHQSAVREGIFHQALEGNLSADRAQDLLAQLENGSISLVPISTEGVPGYKIVQAFNGVVAPLGTASGIIHEEIRLGDVLRDHFGVDPTTEAGKETLHNYAVALANRDPLAARLNDLPEIERLIVEQEAVARQILEQIGVPKSKSSDGWAREIVALALERGWTPKQVQHFAKVLAERPGPLKDTVDYLGGDGNTKLSDTPLGHKWMGFLLLDALRASPDPDSFGATLANLRAHAARFVSGAFEQLDALQGHPAVGFKGLVLRWSFQHNQNPQGWKADLQGVLEGRVEFRVRDGVVERVEYTGQEMVDRQRDMAQRLPTLPVEFLAQASTQNFTPENNRAAMEHFAEHILKAAGYEPSAPEYQRHRDFLIAYFEGVKRDAGGPDAGGWPKQAAELEAHLRDGGTMTFLKQDGNHYELSPQSVAGKPASPPVVPEVHNSVPSWDDDTSAGTPNARRRDKTPANDNDPTQDTTETTTVTNVDAAAYADAAYIPSEPVRDPEETNAYLPSSRSRDKSRQAEKYRIGSFVDHYSHPEVREALDKMAERDDRPGEGWGQRAKVFQDGLVAFEELWQGYLALENTYHDSPSLKNRAKLVAKYEELKQAWGKLHESAYHRMELSYTEAAVAWQRAISPLELTLVEIQQRFAPLQRLEGGLFSYEAVPTPPENLLEFGVEGRFDHVPIGRMGRVEVKVAGWRQAERLVRELRKNPELRVGDLAKGADGLTGTLKVQIKVEGQGQAVFELHFEVRADRQATAAANELSVRENIVMAWERIAVLRTEIESKRIQVANQKEALARGEAPVEGRANLIAALEKNISSQEKTLAKAEQALTASLRRGHRTADGTPYAEATTGQIGSANMPLGPGVAEFKPISAVQGKAGRIAAGRPSQLRIERYAEHLLKKANEEGLLMTRGEAMIEAEKWADKVVADARAHQADRTNIYDTSLPDVPEMRHLDRATVDHHGRFANAQNSTEQLLGRMEGALQTVKGDAKALESAAKDPAAMDAARRGLRESGISNPSEAQTAEVAAALREMKLKTVTTDNLADGGWSVWIAKNQARVLSDPKLRELILGATHFEDFTAFGTDYNQNEPAVRLQAALFQKYGAILESHGIVGSDRFGPEQAEPVMREALTSIDQLVADLGPSRKLGPAAEAEAATFFQGVDAAQQIAAKDGLMAEASVHRGDVNLSFFDLTKLRGFTVFQQWLALPRVQPAAVPDTIQVSVVPMKPLEAKIEGKGKTASRTLQIVAIPNGRKLPSGKGLLVALAAMNAAEVTKAEALGLTPKAGHAPKPGQLPREHFEKLWFGKDNVILPNPQRGGTLLTPKEVSDLLTGKALGLFDGKPTSTADHDAKGAAPGKIEVVSPPTSSPDYFESVTQVTADGRTSRGGGLVAPAGLALGRNVWEVEAVQRARTFTDRGDGDNLVLTQRGEDGTVRKVALRVSPRSNFKAGEKVQWVQPVAGGSGEAPKYREAWLPRGSNTYYLGRSIWTPGTLPENGRINATIERQNDGTWHIQRGAGRMNDQPGDFNVDVWEEGKWVSVRTRSWQSLTEGQFFRIGNEVQIFRGNIPNRTNGQVNPSHPSQRPTIRLDIPIPLDSGDTTLVDVHGTEPVLLTGLVDFSKGIPIKVTQGGTLAQVTTQGITNDNHVNNEDVVASIRTADGRSVMMAIDGMGGHGNGDVAAYLVAEAHNTEMGRSGDINLAWQLANAAVRRFNWALQREFDKAQGRGENVQDPRVIARARQDAISEGQRVIRNPNLGSEQEMATGAGAVAVQIEIVPPQGPEQPHLARFHWMGDARGMLLRRDSRGKWHWIFRTVDENLPNRPGILQPGVDYHEGGRNRTLVTALNPLASVVVNSVGARNHVEVRATKDGEIHDPNSPTGTRLAGNDFAGGIILQPGDLMLAASDGLWENFGHTQLVLELIQGATTAEAAAPILTEETHARMHILDMARKGQLQRSTNHERFVFWRPEGTLYIDGKGKFQRAERMYIDAAGKVYDSPTAENPVDHYKQDNFSLMVKQHNP